VKRLDLPKAADGFIFSAAKQGWPINPSRIDFNCTIRDLGFVAPSSIYVVAPDSCDLFFLRPKPSTVEQGENGRDTQPMKRVGRSRPAADQAEQSGSGHARA
jgi:hypothetical protein